MNEKKYFKKLDIIRVISCFLVLLYHLNIVKGGYLAVCTFFVLSGYLSYTSANGKEKFSLSKYYISRFKKIYIPLLVITAITIIIAKFNSGINWINLKPEGTSVLLGYNNFWQLSANLDYFTRHVNSPFMHLWYIAILMQFELVFPILFWMFKKMDKFISKNASLIVAFLLTLVTTLLFFYMSKTQEIMIVYYNTFARCFSIFFGILIAIIYSKTGNKTPKILVSYRSLIFFVYCIALIILSITVSSTSSHFALFMIIATIISIRLIKYATIEVKTRRKVESKSIFDSIISFFSKCSYEIYLVQYPVIFFMQNVEIRNLIKVPLIILITVVISCILHAILNVNKKKKVLKIIVSGIVLIISIIGCAIIILEKDNSAEMKELEERLNENLKLIEERSSQDKDKAKEENEKWLETIKQFDEDEKKVAEKVRNLNVVGIGDSVLLGAIDGMYSTFPNGYFDGKVSRSVIKSKELFLELKSQGKLTDTIILALANNSDFFEWTLTELFNDLLGGRQIYWVTANYADDPKFNEKFEVFAKNYPNVHIVEWEKKSKDHPEYFYADGIHVKGDGINAFAKTIYDAIYEDYIKEYRVKKEEAVKAHEEQEKEKIAFYGNDILTSSYSFMQEKFTKATFNANSEYDFDTLYSEIKTKVDKEKIERRLVLIFDSKANITSENITKLAKLCENSIIYVCKVSSDKIEVDEQNVKIIDFYSEIKKNKSFLMSDKKHLSESGNEALANMLYTVIEGSNS